MQIKRLFPGDDTTAVARLCAEVQALHAAAEPHRYKQPGRRFVAETARWAETALADAAVPQNLRQRLELILQVIAAQRAPKA